MKIYNTEYNGLYYRYIPEYNKWHIADNPDESAILYIFDADINRLDQCFNFIHRDITMDDIAHWHIDSAKLWLRENRINYRVVSIDGISNTTTNDFIYSRYNIEVSDGLITNIYNG